MLVWFRPSTTGSEQRHLERAAETVGITLVERSVETCASKEPSAVVRSGVVYTPENLRSWDCVRIIVA